VRREDAWYVETTAEHGEVIMSRGAVPLDEALNMVRNAVQSGWTKITLTHRDHAKLFRKHGKRRLHAVDNPLPKKK
jgi:hypothetical protein